LVAALGSLSNAAPQQLSEAEILELIEKLKTIQESAEKSSQSRFALALKAYRAAIKSASATHALFLKCVEKTQFEDMKKSNQDFRDWKRKHNEKEDTPEFRRALQHQLNWLLLSIEASAKPDEIASLGKKALDKIDAIMLDHEALEKHQKLLKKNVLSSAFAKAYNINGLQAKDWPLNPLDLKKIYEKVVLPPLRKPDAIDSLRKVWKKRIEHEGLMLKNWGNVPKSKKIGMKRETLPPEFEKWKQEGYMQLLWNTEMDCYKAGDEKQASANMLKHLTKYISHKQSLKWAGEFQQLMNKELEPEN